MNSQSARNRDPLPGGIPDRDNTFGCRRRQGKGDFMHGHNRHGRRERWHMKMGMGGGHRHGRGGRVTAMT